MNIFYLDPRPDTAAEMHCDKHCVKMILEYAQMLSTAHRVLDEDDAHPDLYKTAHKNHPSTKWVSESSANFENLVEHTMAMIEEYKLRFGKIHKCLYVLEKCVDIYDKSLFPSHSPTRLPLAMPHKFHSNNIVESYRRFYASKPRIRYPKNKIPDWFVKYRGEKEYQVI